MADCGYINHNPVRIRHLKNSSIRVLFSSVVHPYPDIFKITIRIQRPKNHIPDPNSYRPLKIKIRIRFGIQSPKKSQSAIHNPDPQYWSFYTLAYSYPYPPTLFSSPETSWNLKTTVSWGKNDFIGVYTSSGL